MYRYSSTKSSPLRGSPFHSGWTRTFLGWCNIANDDNFCEIDGT